MDPWIVAKVRCFNINNSDRPQSRQGVCTKHPPTQTRTRSSCQAWSSPSHTPPSSSHQADAFSSSKGCLNKANQLSSGPIGASQLTPEHFTFRCRQTTPQLSQGIHCNQKKISLFASANRRCNCCNTSIRPANSLCVSSNSVRRWR